MIILSFIAEGQQHNFASPRRKHLKSLLQDVRTREYPWRLWDGGWIDGSHDAWKDISTIDGKTATLILY